MAAAGESTPHLKAVQDLVTAEVAAYLTGRRAQAVAPTVAALRSRAADVVAAEMTRLEQRLPSLGEQTRAEVQLAVHRVVEKLLHTPTVRVKELAGEGSGRRLRPGPARPVRPRPARRRRRVRAPGDGAAWHEHPIRSTTDAATAPGHGRRGAGSGPPPRRPG